MAPKKHKSPTDTNQLAKHILDLATGQSRDADPNACKDTTAAERGQNVGAKGGKAGVDNLTPEQRSEIAKKAASP